MNEVNNTLYIPLYGKSKVSQQGIILSDPSAERIWKEEAFPIIYRIRRQSIEI